MEFYLDNAATTKPSEGTVSVIQKVLTEAYGNPSSLHRKGQEAEKYMITARRQLAKILNVDPESIYFTSCATESSNTAIKGAAANKIPYKSNPVANTEKVRMNTNIGTNNFKNNLKDVAQTFFTFLNASSKKSSILKSSLRTAFNVILVVPYTSKRSIAMKIKSTTKVTSWFWNEVSITFTTFVSINDSNR